MEFRELTSSNISILGPGCAEHFLHERLCGKYVWRRNRWIREMLKEGLSGIIAMNDGRLVASTFEFPIEIAPLPVFGRNIAVLMCMWICPPLAKADIKRMLIEKAIEKLSCHGFDGIVAISPMNVDIAIWEAEGFIGIGKTDSYGSHTRFVFMKLRNDNYPSIMQSKPIGPAVSKNIVLDVFCPIYCPLGMIIQEWLNTQKLAKNGVELRFSDTSIRSEVVKHGRVLGCFLNGIDILPAVVRNTPLEKILQSIPNHHSASSYASK